MAAVAVPYLWTIGVFTFSSGLFWGGIHGEPRRTNTGLSYLNSDSPMFRSDWVTSAHIGAIGGVIMTLAILVYFYVLIRSLMGPSVVSEGEQFELPESEVLHDEDVAGVKNFFPWVTVAVLACIVAYTPPILQIVKAKYTHAVGYHPDNPASVK